VREAKDALRLRYANGEINREDYLQGKVELENGHGVGHLVTALMRRQLSLTLSLRAIALR